MKKILILFITLQLSAQITKVEPPFWWEGMKNSSLMITLYGDNLHEYDVNSESTGITNLLKDIKDAGLKLQDLKTEQTTLEKIFVSLVKENNEI